MLSRQYLEYYITYHCNLKCENCSVGSPFIDPRFSDLESYKNDVDNLKQYMHIGVMRLIGGEPTLNPEIVEYLKYAKESGFADKTSVATNGIKLLSMPDDFWKWCDIINLSIYPNTSINYEKILNFLDTNGYRYNITNKPATIKAFQSEERLGSINLEWGATFRILDQFEPHEEEVAQKVYETCVMHDWCHTFKNGNYYRCGFSIHRNVYYDSIGVPLNYDLRETDKIVIDENFIENYEKHSTSKKININACRFCKGFGNAIEPVNMPYRQLSSDEVSSRKNIT
jgi:organic radical activating enzyme